MGVLAVTAVGVMLAGVSVPSDLQVEVVVRERNPATGVMQVTSQPILITASGTQARLRAGGQKAVLGADGRVVTHDLGLAVAVKPVLIRSPLGDLIRLDAEVEQAVDAGPTVSTRSGGLSAVLRPGWPATVVLRGDTRHPELRATVSVKPLAVPGR
jgi:hypothetical protein